MRAGAACLCFPSARADVKHWNQDCIRVGVSEIRIGISGWRYAPWRGVFYPVGLPQREELSFAARHFDSIEINGSFYSVQRPELYRRWYAETPPGFVFSVKGPRYITHMKKLRDVRGPLANFLASGVLALSEKLGPILWQFPESFPCEMERFREFFAMLPRSTKEAALLSRARDSWLAERSITETAVNRPLRHAVEIRSRTCATAEFIELLRELGIALVVADTAGRWPFMEDVTADFVYVRLHGDKELYKSGYSPEALAEWSRKILAWSCGNEPHDAMTLSTHRPKKRKGRDVPSFSRNLASHSRFSMTPQEGPCGVPGAWRARC